MSRPLLLKGGTVIVHDAQDKAKGIKADLLVRGNKIAEISPNIKAPSEAEVVDCQDKIIAPGFIDTHRHMWNTALRGRHGDNLLQDYIVQGGIETSPRTKNLDPFRHSTDESDVNGRFLTCYTTQVFFRVPITNPTTSFGVNWQVVWSV